MSKILSEKDVLAMEALILKNEKYIVLPDSKKTVSWDSAIANLIDSHRTLQRRVEWTTDPKQQKEQFWWFSERGLDPVVVHVRLVIDLLYAFFPSGRREPLENLKGEWAGPLEPPHEARG